MPDKNREYYAVIFSSSKAEDVDPDYALTAEKMYALVKEQVGFLGHESYRNTNGEGVTISYWESKEAIQNWKNNLEHSQVQKLGKEKWYQRYKIRICKVEAEYGFGEYGIKF